MTDTDKLLLPVTRATLKLFFSKVSCINELVMTKELSEICENIKIENYENAENILRTLKTEVTQEKLIEYMSIIFSTILENKFSKNLNNFSKLMDTLHRLDAQAVTSLYIIIDLPISLKLMDLAKKTSSVETLTFHVLKMFLNFFEMQGDWEPQEAKKIREDLEYVELIKMYLNGSKELPERKTDNFNYALLSEFLKKDDLKVLKSIEDYLDSAETKALGAAGAVAQSIEKEDLEPGVKKVKKDIERIEKLED